MNQNLMGPRIWPVIATIIFLLAFPVGYLIITQANVQTSGALKKNLTGMVKSALVDNQAQSMRVLPKSKGEVDKEIISLAQKGVLRLKTFTNQDHFENVSAMRPLVTDEYWQELEAFKVQQEAKSKSEDAEFYGVVTLIEAAQLKENNLTQAIVDVIAKKNEYKGSRSVGNTSFEQYEVSLVFQNGEWLISGIK